MQVNHKKQWSPASPLPTLRFSCAEAALSLICPGMYFLAFYQLMVYPCGVSYMIRADPIDWIMASLSIF